MQAGTADNPDEMHAKMLSEFRGLRILAGRSPALKGNLYEEYVLLKMSP